MSVISPRHHDDEQERWDKLRPEEKRRRNNELHEKWRVENEKKRKEAELSSRLEAAMKRVTLVQLQALTIEEFSQLSYFFSDLNADYAEGSRMPHLEKIEEILQKHGFM